MTDTTRNGHGQVVSGPLSADFVGYSYFIALLNLHAINKVLSMTIGNDFLIIRLLKHPKTINEKDHAFLESGKNIQHGFDHGIHEHFIRACDML